MFSESIRELPEIDLDGFQVVKGEMFQTGYNRTAVTMSVWPDSISFSQSSINALKKCERVRIEVNVERKSVLVIPVTIQDRDNIRWAVANKSKARRISCSRFSSQLYRAWEWNPHLAYKAAGKLVSSNNKVMLLYSFDDATTWRYVKADGDE